MFHDGMIFAWIFWFLGIYLLCDNWPRSLKLSLYACGSVIGFNALIHNCLNILPLLIFHSHPFYAWMVELCSAADFSALWTNLWDAPTQMGNSYGYMSYTCKFYRQVLALGEPSPIFFKAQNWKFTKRPMVFSQRPVS